MATTTVYCTAATCNRSRCNKTESKNLTSIYPQTRFSLAFLRNLSPALNNYSYFNNVIMDELLDSAQNKTFIYLQEVERVSQDILTLREEKLKLANAQNMNREALRALEQVYERNTWMKLGSVRIERPTEECKGILRNEIAAADERLKSLHEEIKDKVHKLRDLEHEPRLEGFALKPISVAEAKALHARFGNV